MSTTNNNNKLPATLRVSGRTMSNKWFFTWWESDATARDRFRENIMNLHAEGKLHYAAGQDEQASGAAIHIQGTLNTYNDHKHIFNTHHRNGDV